MRVPGRTHASPRSGAISPSQMRSSVDLPAPFGPMTVTISRSFTARSTATCAGMTEKKVSARGMRGVPRAGGLAGGADAGELDHAALDVEALVHGAAPDRLAETAVVELRGHTAAAADQELHQMRFAGMGAPDECVQRFDAVDEPALEQEVQRPIDGRRGGVAAVLLQAVEDGVGADRPMAAPDQLQHPATDRGQPLAGLAADALGGVEGGGDAMVVVVARFGKNRVFHGHLAGSRVL